PRAVPRGRSGWHDRRAGAGSRGGGAAAAGGAARGRAPAEDGSFDRGRVRDRGTRRRGAGRGVRSAPGVRRGRWARVPDLRRRPGCNGDLESAREDRGEGRSVRQVDLRHPARRGRRPGGGGTPGGAGGRPPAPSGVSFSYAGGAGALRSEERRVGKECRNRGWAYHEKQKKDGSKAEKKRRL